MATWHVLGNQITQTTQLVGNGLVDVVEIPVMVDSGPAMGSTVTVRIPASRKGDQVFAAAAIQAEIDAHDGLAQLAGGA